ncbi:MAG TPA: GNAT family N-acetyltransferase [Rhodobacteraceae bacterium]|nr:GNAT family N-acetyltransferase [Paracoccaceae bacterium]HBG98948.1 GNAT family N-acetyltransferase [Paracoccaceae bacterium]
MAWKDDIAPVLEAGDARLELIAERHRDGIEAQAYDPDIWTYFVARVDTPEAFETFMRTALEDTAAGRRYVYVVIDKRSGRVAGSMCYGNLAEADRRLEIGWSWLGRDFRGAGLNRWAKLALLSQAFDRLQAERVEFKTDVLNERARKGLLKIGATEEGVLRSFNFMPGGRRRDAIFYSVLRREWPEVRARLEGRTDAAA